MSAVAENILTGLPAGRAAVFLGEAGCGKSELAVHLALSLAGKGREVHFFDLDQTKPLMRSRDAQELLEGAAWAPLPLIPITTHISVPETELD